MPRKQLKVVDLFSGIGGMPLGLERTRGFKVLSFCEIDDFRAGVLARHWPGRPIYGAIQNYTPKEFPDSDWITGGPPCHRTSIAAAITGNWTGETLWPEMYRILKGKRPYGTIVEQPNKHEEWKRTVQRNLETLGYEVTRYVIPAEAVGAIHTRERVFIVAHRYGKRLSLPRGPKPSEIETYSRAASTRSHWDTPPRGILRLDDGLRRGMDRCRKARIRAAGSSCVPQVAEVLGLMILNGFKNAS